MVMVEEADNLQAPYLPVPIDDVEIAFPAHVRRLMPAESEIPEPFWKMSFNDASEPAAKWVKFQTEWFYRGLQKDTLFELKEGIDGKEAIRHLSAIQGSFEPKHEYKQAAVAYLASLWFEDVAY